MNQVANSSASDALVAQVGGEIVPAPDVTNPPVLYKCGDCGFKVS